MTSPPFSNLQPGFQRETPISLPTWILSVDGIFQIEYSLSCGFAWRSPPARRPEREGSLFHASNTHKPVPGISYESNCIRLHLKGTFPLHFCFPRKILHASLCHKSIKPITQIVSNGLLPYIWTQMSGLVKWSTQEFLKALENNLICLLGLLFHGSVLLFCNIVSWKTYMKESVVKRTHLQSRHFLIAL